MQLKSTKLKTLPLKAKTLAFKTKSLPFVISASVMAAGAPLSSVAQEAALQLEEVMVTARKRTESLQSAPVSAAIFDADSLADAQINAATEIIERVPGLVINSDNVTQPNVFMRGIGTDIQSAASNPSVGMFVNEVYMARAMAFSMELFDLQQVEVVRGPQGILYGKNVTGGVVNFVTNKPTDETTAGFRAGGGNYNLIEVQGFANGALSDTVQGRISATSRSRDGYAKNTFTGNDMEDLQASSVRGQLRFLPNEDLDILVSADTNRHRSTAQWIDIVIPSEHNIPFKNPDPRKGPNNVDGKSDADVDGIDVTVNWSTDAGALTSITALRTGTFEGVSNDGGSYIDFTALPYGDDGRVDFGELHFGGGPVSNEDFNDDYYLNEKKEDVDTFSQELRWTSTLDGSLNYMTGLFYMTEKIDRSEDQTYLFVEFFNQGFESARTQSDNTTFGVFGELTWDLSDTLSVVAGARYTYDEKEFEVERGNEGDFLGAPFFDENGNIVNSFTASDKKDWDSIDPSLTVNWQATDDVFLYATYSTGFKSGGWNGENATTAAEATASYDEEDATNYEIGAKTELFDSRLRLNATAFFTQYDDLQTQQFVIFDANLPADNIIANAGEAEVKGVEIEFAGLITDWWTVSGSYAYQDGEITGDLISTDLQYDPSCDCSVPVPSNLKGNDLRRTPENSYNLVNTFSFDMGNSGEIDVVVDYAFTGEYEFDNENNPRTTNDDFGIWNASVNWMSADQQWEVSVWGKNLDDELYFSGKTDVIGSVLGSYGAPRTYGVNLRWMMP
tara:strand:- start:132736 stop:135099 length:2364 start_codon:yes stop_codon:yes gene_type:complete